MSALAGLSIEGSQRMELARIQANVDIFLQKKRIPSTRRNDVSSIMIYTRVLNKGGHGIRGPVDGL